MSWLFLFIPIFFRHFLSRKCLPGWHRGPEGRCVDAVSEEEEQECGDHQRRQGLNSTTQPELSVWSSLQRGSSTPPRLALMPLRIISRLTSDTLDQINPRALEGKILALLTGSPGSCAVIKAPSLKFLQMRWRAEIMWLRCRRRDDLTGTGRLKPAIRQRWCDPRDKGAE